MKKTVLAIAAGLVLAPAGANAASTICAPSDPAGYYACASVSVQWVSGGVQLSVQNLDTWDATLSNVVGGYRLSGIGIVGSPSLSSYLTGSVTTAAGAGASWSGAGAGTQWNFNSNVNGIFVEAGAVNNGAPGALQGCQTLAGPAHWKTCNGPVVFTFATNGLSQETFASMSFEFGMRGISGPGDSSFRCGPNDNNCSPTTTTVPEPMSMVLLGTGLVGLGIARRRRTNNDVTNA